VEGVVAINAVPGEVNDVAEDEEGEEEGGEGRREARV
jgi:hypothetical protein